MWRSLALLFALVVAIHGARKIYDPLNLFCGPDNCYDVLGVKKSATQRQLKKAYLRKSQQYHPDKNKDKNATVVFQKIAKAFEVLDNNKTRETFNTYLKHPTDYFTASNGQQHYYMALPKAPLWAVVVFCLAALSVFLHVVQGTRHARALRILKEKVGKGLQERDGGNRQTTELFRLAEERYIQLKQEGARAEGAAPTPGTVVNANTKKAEKKLMKGQVKREAMLEDPDFRRIVDDLIGSIKIEGDYAKPEMKDLFVLRLVHMPYSLYLWAVKYHRRYLSGAELSLEERTEMAEQAVGLSTWDELNALQRAQCIEREVWKSQAYDKWILERDKELKRKGKRNDEDAHLD